ncbi:MAG TPA: LpqB family beta-propeller domain-containing protein [Gemmatimonadales bacterium]
MKPAPSDRGRACRGLPVWTPTYLLLGLGLATWPDGALAQAPTVAEVQITPETMTLGLGQKQALFATAFDARGNLIAAAKFTFWSSDTMIAQVRKDGTVVGVNPGLAKIEARTGGRRASMAVLITGSPPGARAQPVSSLTLDPAGASLFPGENVRVTPRAVREDGSPALVGRVTWISRNPEIATVDTGGVVTGVAPGRAVIEASSGSKLVATLTVTVSPPEYVLSRQSLNLAPGEVDTLRALVPSQGNRELRGLVQWRSSDSSVASVSPTGIVRAHGAGKTEVIASGLSLERRIPVTVHRDPAALVVSPQPSAGPIQVPLRSSRRFTAVAEADDSTSIPEARVTWELADTAVASFDPGSGMLTPRTLGTTTLTARTAGIRPAVWTIEVTAGEIGVQPERAGLAIGQRTTLAAILRDAPGGEVGKAPAVRWSSDRPDVALAREGGVVEGVGPGRAAVTATTPWGKSARADVIVTADLLLSSSRGGSYGIYQIRVTGPHTLMPLLTDTATNIQASLSPDRTRVAFSSNRGGNFDLYLMDADGQNLRRLTTDPRNEGDPFWTPDGTRIVYTSTRGTGTQIAIISLDGSEVVLTATPGGNHSPAVSPDGRTIAFVSARDGNQELYSMGIDGSNPRRITRTSVREASPRFFPNGDLAFAVERGGGSKGSKILRLAMGGSKTTSILQTEQPISALAVSRDGDRLAYVVGRIADAARGRVEFSLFLQSTATGSPPVPVPLKSGEQILTPSF